MLPNHDACIVADHEAGHRRDAQGRGHFRFVIDVNRCNQLIRVQIRIAAQHLADAFPHVFAGVAPEMGVQVGQLHGCVAPTRRMWRKG